MIGCLIGFTLFGIDNIIVIIRVNNLVVDFVILIIIITFNLSPIAFLSGILWRMFSSNRASLFGALMNSLSLGYNSSVEKDVRDLLESIGLETTNCC